MEACKRSRMSKSKKEQEMMEIDGMSKIPDEILVDILSRLSMKEAARTSVVCRSWKSLWKFYSGCMDFDYRRQPIGRKEFGSEEKKYIDWVNHVVFSHQGSSVKQLRILFHLGGENQTGTIDTWIGFAAGWRVERLELDLSPLGANYKNLSQIYNFPIPPRLKKLGDCFKSLTSLLLKYVNVTDKHVPYFLSDCPLLEALSIGNAPSLCNARVIGCGPAAFDLRLMHLEICNCSGLQHLEVVAARNLSSFRYAGPIINMHFRDVPQLSWVTLGRGDCCKHLVATAFNQLPLPVSQLHILTLDLHNMISYPYDYEFPYQGFAVQLTNLRQLELTFCILNYQTMFFVCSFLHASPALRKLVLKYQISPCQTQKLMKDPEHCGFEVRSGEWRQRLARRNGCKYKCLKEVEFLGWNGFKTDLEFAAHIIEAAGSLEKITIDPEPPREGMWEGIWREIPRSLDDISDARTRAMYLAAKLCTTTRLVVL